MCGVADGPGGWRVGVEWVVGGVGVTVWCGNPLQVTKNVLPSNFIHLSLLFKEEMASVLFMVTQEFLSRRDGQKSLARKYR